MSEWLDAGERECSALVVGDPVTGAARGAVVVFGSTEEVEAALEGEFDFVLLAAPADLLAGVVRITTLRVDRRAVVEVEPFDFEAALDGEEPGGWTFG